MTDFAACAEVLRCEQEPGMLRLAKQPAVTVKKPRQTEGIAFLNPGLKRVFHLLTRKNYAS